MSRLHNKLRNGAIFGTVVGSITCGTALSSFAGEPPKVAVSILPVHSLVQSVMEGVGEAELLMDQGSSPHGYSLRPSQVKALNNADLIVWVGEGLETFLEKPIAARKENAKALELMEIKGVTLLENRHSGQWSEGAHDHDEHHDGEHEEHEEHSDHDEGHDDHAHDNEHEHKDEHEHEGEHEHEEEHEHGEEHVHHDDDEHDHGKFDPHIWLSIENAKAIVSRVGGELTEIDPDNASTYQSNVEKTLADLDVLKQDLKGQISGYEKKPYLVFHDAYQYFENEFSLSAVGSVTIDAERKPGAKRISELRDVIRDRKAECIYQEPQFKPVVVEVLAENLEVKIGELDPLGAKLEAGPEAYKNLMSSLGDNLVSCLAKK
ncbi:zinc ABC transporter substrate-binding protein [Kiloniella majae]|uniref:zinc ABC transporter substrate-binding protein n=1 Tax=Kiloniella majae TaxID=1938558 RepID=UPI000A278739|nr:zinc ABC transporter substrate-binding protein [Kiloniella majae]